MTSKKKSENESVYAEAWHNMNADMDKFLPQKLRGGKGKLKLGLGLVLIELLALGLLGKVLYDWLSG